MLEYVPIYCDKLHILTHLSRRNLRGPVARWTFIYKENRLQGRKQERVNVSNVCKMKNNQLSVYDEKWWILPDESNLKQRYVNITFFVVVLNTNLIESNMSTRIRLFDSFVNFKQTTFLARTWLQSPISPVNAFLQKAENITGNHDSFLFQRSKFDSLSLLKGRIHFYQEKRPG